MNRHMTVLGGGLSGLAVAQRATQLGFDIDVYEANEQVGGHASSHRTELGYTFDEGPHISFTKNDAIRDLLAKAVDDKHWEFEASIFNLWRAHWVRHPAQCNLFGLPLDTVANSIVDLAKAQSLGDRVPVNYGEWCRFGLGDTFCEQFSFPYTRKYWTVEAEVMSTDWVGSRVYAPKIEEVVRGALGQSNGDLNYITRFRYPKSGGFGSYISAVNTVSPDRIHLRRRVVGVDQHRKEITFSDGERVSYDFLVSSLPITRLIEFMRDVPTSVLEASKRLVCTSVTLVNISLRRAEGFPGGHWFYVYDEDLIISRVHYPHRLSPGNAPAGCGSIQVEVYHSRFKPLPTVNVAERVVEELRSMFVILPDDDICDVHEMAIPFANILFTLERENALQHVNDYLATHGVHGCGRFGEWKYYWSDDSILSGWRVAEAIHDLL